jgi:integrase
VLDDDGRPMLTAAGKPKRRELGSTCPELAKNSKHGTWGFQIDVAAVPGSGKERQRVRRVGFRTKSEADAARTEIKNKGRTAANRRVPNEKVTVAEYLERWIDGRRGLRPKTLESYQGHVTKYLIPYLGAILLRDLEDHHISAMFTAIEERNEAIRRSLETAPRRRRGTYLKVNEVAEGARRELRKVIGPASQQRLRATLRKALTDALRKKLIAGPNPASMVELESGESPPPELWTAETEARWRETGAVPGSTMVWRGAVPLDARLLAMFKTHRTEQKKDRMRWDLLWVDSGRVFVRENGERLEPDAVSDTFRKLSRQADLPPVRLHAMRSGAATMALAAGVPMKTVSEMLGHASEAITSTSPLAVGDELKREAITSIGVLIPRRATGTEEAS